MLEDVEDDVERKVIIDIERQRAFLVVHDIVAIDTAVSTARRGKHTPRGSYTVTEKIRSGKVSTIYNVYMPNWMRIGRTTIGMHTGDLPGYPASAGCVRLPQSVAPVMYEHTQRGSSVEIVDSWGEENLLIPYSAPDKTDLQFAIADVIQGSNEVDSNCRHSHQPGCFAECRIESG